MPAMSLKTLAKKSRTITTTYRLIQFYRSAPWSDLFDADKKKLIAAVRRSTMLTWRELSALYDAATTVERERLKGSVVELGVCQGGSAGILAALTAGKQQRHVWLFDSWEGLPESSPDDVTTTGEKGEAGMCLASEARVHELLYRRLGLSPDYVHTVRGWFDSTVPQRKEAVGPIALLHIDCDWYESVRFCLAELYDRVIPAGFVFIDDYGYWAGCRKAVDEFFAARKTSVPLIRVDSTVVYLRKPAPWQWRERANS